MADAESESRDDLCYVETSALIAALLEQDVAIKRALRRPRRRVTSALTAAEARRTIVRARAAGRIDAKQEQRVARALETFLQRCDIVAILDDILLRAGRPFPIEPVRTLDAIHLATMESLGESPALVTVLSRDGRIRSNAEAAGYRLE